MFFGWNVAEVGVIHGSAKGNVSVAFHEPGHQRSAAGFNDGRAVNSEPSRRRRDCFDPAAFNKHIAGKGCCAAAVPNTGAAKKNWLHSVFLRRNCKTDLIDLLHTRRCGSPGRATSARSRGRRPQTGQEPRTQSTETHCRARVGLAERGPKEETA